MCNARYFQMYTRHFENNTIIVHPRMLTMAPEIHTKAHDSVPAQHPLAGPGSVLLCQSLVRLVVVRLTG